ncbi:MAG: hypothetical protein WCA79_14130 [Anaerolineales bacterium]
MDSPFDDIKQAKLQHEQLIQQRREKARRDSDRIRLEQAEQENKLQNSKEKLYKQYAEFIANTLAQFGEAV